MFCHQCQETMKNTGCARPRAYAERRAKSRTAGPPALRLPGHRLLGRARRGAGNLRRGPRLLRGQVPLRHHNQRQLLGRLLRRDRPRRSGEARQAPGRLATAGGATGGDLPLTPLPSPRLTRPRSGLSRRRAGAAGWRLRTRISGACAPWSSTALKGISAYVEHAYALGKSSRKVFSFMLRLGQAHRRDAGADALTALVLETGAMGVEAMALLDGANIGAYGSLARLRSAHGHAKPPGHPDLGPRPARPARPPRADQGHGRGRVHPRRDAAGPLLPLLREVRQSLRQLRRGLVVPGQRDRQVPRARALHLELHRAAPRGPEGADLHDGSGGLRRLPPRGRQARGRDEGLLRAHRHGQGMPASRAALEDPGRTK
jgi:hypothetical protein